MSKYQGLYWYYRRCGFDKVRAQIMAMPLWISMICVPIFIMSAFMIILKFV